MFYLEVRSELRPTEDLRKVREAMNKLFDFEDVRVVNGRRYKEVVGTSKNINSLIKFHRLLRQERILDSARKVMLSSISRGGDEVRFKLHKQSAYAGHISFVSYDEESPLGPIKVLIRSDKLMEIIDWLAPKTSKGKPLWEISPPDTT